MRDQRLLESLEAEFRAKLLRALHETIAQRSGMFGSYLEFDQPKVNEAYYELNRLGKDITDLRIALGIRQDFPLFERYALYCRRHGPHDPPEAELAKAFLDELKLTF